MSLLVYLCVVQYLEEFECVRTIAIAKRKPVTLFSTYEDLKLGMYFSHHVVKMLIAKVFCFSSAETATELDAIENIIIEPYIDAVTKMSVFIGDKKYKEDFI